MPHSVRIQALCAGFFIAAAASVASANETPRLQSGISPADLLERADDRPLEQIPGVFTVYGSVETGDGVRLRTLIAIPESASAPLKPLLFTQWVSCGSVEYRAGSGGREILARLARESGLALVRVERAGSGDSESPACDALDYDTEVQHYTDAFAQLLENELIDPSAVYLYGASLGTTTAPLVAAALQTKGYDIAGIAVQGGGALTHFERMLIFDRLYLERRPDAVAPASIHDGMRARSRFHTEYLIKGRQPDDIAADSAEMAAVRADIRGLGETDHYGRPFAWHQQAARRNFLSAWAAVDAPALVIFNSFDQFETRDGHALIVETINRLRPGTAKLIEQQGVGHSNRRFESLEAAYAGEGGEPAWDETASLLTGWFQEQQDNAAQ